MRHSIPTTSLFLFALLAGCATPADESAGSPSDRVAGSQQMHQIEEDPDQRSDEEQKLQFQIEERERAEREAADLKAAREAADQAAKEEAEKRAAMEADAQAQREAEEEEAAKRAEEEEADRQAAAQEAAAEEAAAQEAASAGSEASDDPDPQHSADAPPPLYGQITADGAAVAGARICIRGTEICEWSDDDGYFKLNGLEDGISEELVVDAPDFPVVIAPIELFPSEYRWLELPLPPRGQTHVDVGAVYVASQGHIEFGVQAKPVDGSWKLVEGSLDIQRDSREATELMNDIRPGLYEAHFTPTDSADCLRVLGWANPDASGQHLSMLVPVYGGAVTVIAKVCAAY